MGSIYGVHYIGLCELLLRVSASDSEITRFHYLNKPRYLPCFSVLTLLSLAFQPSVLIPYGNHDRDGRPAHHEPFKFYKGGLIPDKL